MFLSDKFICAGTEYSTFEKHVPAPYIRKSFYIDAKPENAEVTVCGLGFYRIFVNGEEVTPGFLSPYISNPDDIVYYNNIDILPYLTEGENVIGLILGNGMMNCIGGRVWGFDSAPFRGAPRTAVAVECIFADGDKMFFEADESFLTHPSPIFFDDLRCGEFYDARNEADGWSKAGTDTSEWRRAVFCSSPKGERRLITAEPIICSEKIKPVSVKKAEKADYKPKKDCVADIIPAEAPQPEYGYLYDFGINSAGTVTLNIRNSCPGQRIEMQFCESLENGKASYKKMECYPDGYAQRDIYICKGGNESYTPSFTYHGFRYCFVTGVEDEQADDSLLEFNIMHSDIDRGRGDFRCSDEMTNRIQRAARNSVLSNFYHFPTDCPHREKNGWTGDAAVSAEYMLLNFNAEELLAEWVCNICAAQREDGALPGIVPTTGWGFGCGPAWDRCLIYLPYYIYKYTGKLSPAKSAAGAIKKYLEYLKNSRSEDGLIREGLGDWVSVGRSPGDYKAPKELTGNLVGMSSCKYAAVLFDALGAENEKQFALRLYGELRAAAREKCICPDGVTAIGSCQTSQAASLYYGLFDESEQKAAFDVLMQLIEKENFSFDCGVIGMRVLFHTLAEYGETELAWKMITKETFPGYGYNINFGHSALWEEFKRDEKEVDSYDHHLFGDVSNFFITKIAGITVNPFDRDPLEIHLRPYFISEMDFAEAHFDTSEGQLYVKWEREKSGVILYVTSPETVFGAIRLPNGYMFTGQEENCGKMREIPLKSGVFRIGIQ